ncbi:MAG: regulatory iron-sulfur-containing complex subunit RicT [Candidatus Hydrothermales bacterium]
MRFFKKDENIRSLEVSIIGGPLARYSISKDQEIEKDIKFAFIEVENEEKPLIVKVRGISNRPSRLRLKKILPCDDKEIVKLLRNIVYGILFNEKISDVRIVDIELYKERGFVRFTFTADKRYDLSKIAPTIARKLHLHTEFRQKGTRDYARELGGLGSCGRIICCGTWLKEIPPITIDMARKQYIFTAPENLTGICGRLLCCLRFELNVYEELSKGMPEIGKVVFTGKGKGKVSDIDVFKREFKLSYEDGSEEWIKIEENL